MNSDPNKAVAFEPGKVVEPAGDGTLPGQPQVTPPAQAGQEPSSAPQPKFITLEEAQKLANQAALDAEERAFRRAQGLVSKADNRITAKVQQDLAALQQMITLQKSAGIEVTPQQEAQLRNQIIANAYSQGEQPPPNTEPPATPKPAEQSEASDPITAEAWRLMQAAGIVINENDPEVGQLDQSSGYAFLRSIETAIESKRQRIASTPMQVPGRTPTGAGATGAHQANPIQDVNDPEELFRIAKERGLI
jgi:hypothetical protein